MTQKIRDEVADFLQKHLDNVTRIEKEKPGSVNMRQWVGEYDKENECGTVCCMEGWLPNTYPELFKWVGGEFVGRIGEEDEFYTPLVNIDVNLWRYLTGTTYFLYYIYSKNIVPYPPINIDSTFEEVKRAWGLIIEDIRGGVLDDFLNEDL